MLKLQYFGHWYFGLQYFDTNSQFIGKDPWCWERMKAKGERDDRGWDGWVASLMYMTLSKHWEVVKDREARVCYSPWGHKKLTEWLKNKNNMQLNIKTSAQSKMAGRLKQTSFQKDIQMGKRHMKRHSTSPIIREMQIKITIKYQFIAVRMAIIKKSKNTD